MGKIYGENLWGKFMGKINFIDELGLCEFHKLFDLIFFFKDGSKKSFH